MKSQRLGFTLVELIVVIVILGVLSTIGFVSYNGYLAGARDSNRVTQLKNINDSLTLYTADKDLPLPDDYVSVVAGSNVVGYQGYAGQNTLELINYTNGGRDPKDDAYYTYYLSADKKKVQLLTFLEETDNLQTSIPFIGQAHAVDYSTRFPKVYGKKLGVLVLTSNQKPIQEIGSITTAGSLDISSTSSTFTAYYSDTDSLEGDNSVLVNMTANASCKRIKEVGDSKGNGLYDINPTGSAEFEVYCEMENGGGGWTHIGSKINGSANSVGDLGTVATKPSVAANVKIPQDAFRTNLTEAMACSTENCWVWPLNDDFKGMFTSGATSGATVTPSGSMLLKRVSGNSGFTTTQATSFWYDAESGTESAMFDIRGTADGAGASTDRWSMDGQTSAGSWAVSDQWDIYVR